MAGALRRHASMAWSALGGLDVSVLAKKSKPEHVANKQMMKMANDVCEVIQGKAHLASRHPL